MGSRLHEGRLFAGMTEEGVREGVIRMKDGFSPPVLKGAGYSRGMTEGMGEGGMGPRIREDNGRGAKGMGSRLRGKNGWGRWG